MTGRTLIPDDIDSWSEQWVWTNELEFEEAEENEYKEWHRLVEGRPTITNQGREWATVDGVRVPLVFTHSFRPFDDPLAYAGAVHNWSNINHLGGGMIPVPDDFDPDSAANKPAGWTPRAAISDTIGVNVQSAIGVQAANTAMTRVNATSGPMR
jgi:hypothetical protein